MCEKPAKYTRQAPRIDAQMAAVIRWVKVEVVLALVCSALLVIDMAFPSGLSAGNKGACKTRHERARKGVQTAPAHRGFVVQ
jgi:hypothetical protein